MADYEWGNSIGPVGQNAMSTVIQPLTADDLWGLPNGKGQRHELVRGELRTMPPAGFEHGAIGVNLMTPLTQHVKANSLGLVVNADTGFVLARDPDTVRAPDIGFVARERIEQLGVPKKYFPGAPDLAAEVVSPSDTLYEVDEKVLNWLEAGARLVWVVNPRRRTVTASTPGGRHVILTEADELDGQDVVPGFRFRVRVADIFVIS